MADPLLDEDLMVQLLSVTPSIETVTQLQAGAVQVVCDLYDRGVKRDEFTSKASAAIGLYAQCAKLWLLNNVHNVHTAGELDDARFKLAHDGLLDVITKQAEVVREIAATLRQCPTSQDVVH